MANPLRRVITDDTRAYRAIEVLVAAAHVAETVERTCGSPSVGLLLPTSGVFPIAAIGAWMTGRTIVPLNYLLKPDELQYVVDDSGIDTIFTVQPMLEHLGSPPRIKNLRLVEDIDMAGVPAPTWPARPGDEEIAAVVYTSGTSGKPKGVMLSHRALKANVRQGVKHLGLSPRGDIMLGVLPQFHCYGLTQLTLTPLSHGVPVVYTARFMPKRLIELVKKERATVLVGIPSMFNAIASLKSGTPEHFESLRLIVSGSEALPDAVQQKFSERYGKPITEGYGMTEMSPATHCAVPGRTKPHSVGQPVPGVVQRIVSPETGADQPAGEPGEIRLDGPNRMTGYLHLPDKTAEAFDEQGFYRTGDLGRVDEEGYLYITGRIKEMMIIGGENVFPREIEEVLDRHEIVHASGVIGQHDPTRGEVPVAFVELEEGVDPDAFDERTLISFCREHLAGYKAPKRVIRLDALPRNPTGKILRRDLKDHLEALGPVEVEQNV
ncbi:MAG: AMP-binding protein [Phycisphaeraceae bacterium]|nr:MAG: AMP-binding protein [Phycisphaeraceae bacterium]